MIRAGLALSPAPTGTLMRASATQHLFAEIRAPLLRALRLLGPHFPDVRLGWRKKLHQLGLSDHEVSSLQVLALDVHREPLEAADFATFRAVLERSAQTFESNGLPESKIVAALGLYLQCCLPYLFAQGAKGKEPALALAQCIAAAEAVLLSAYAAGRAVSTRRLQEQERHSLSRDLHDDIGHNLLVLKLYLELMTMDLGKGDVSQLESKLQEALALVSHAIDSVRRLMLDLGPAMLSQFGFLRALRVYARQFALRTGIDIQVSAPDFPESLPSSHETALYRVLQGALSNVLQHSSAKHVKLNIGTTKGLVVMSIEDDGSGFDVSTTMRQRAFGLRAMRERIELLGGRFHMDSTPARPGVRRHGTRIEIDLPLHELERK